MDKIDLKNHECDNELIYNNIELLKNFINDFKFLLKDTHLIQMSKEYKIDLNIAFKCLIKL